MPRLIQAAVAVGKTPESEQCNPIWPNCSAFHTPSKKILAKLKEDNVTDMSPCDHIMPPPSLQLSVDMISYAQTAIDGYDEQDHLTENNGVDNDDDLSEFDDDNRDRDYKQRDSSDDDDDLNVAVCKPGV
jgi:hypothetical protein